MLFLIDIHSARFDSKVKFPRLFSRTGTFIDNSLENAYVHYIRSAKHFIYLETQMLIGSSGKKEANSIVSEVEISTEIWTSKYNISCIGMWSKQRGAGAKNVIPGELAYKIVEKIKQKRKFHVYVVLSMFPSGDPASEFVQQQLYWQFLTLEMILRKVTVQIKLAGRISLFISSSDLARFLSMLCPSILVEVSMLGRPGFLR